MREMQLLPALETHPGQREMGRILSLSPSFHLPDFSSASHWPKLPGSQLHGSLGNVVSYNIEQNRAKGEKELTKSKQASSASGSIELTSGRM